MPIINQKSVNNDVSLIYIYSTLVAAKVIGNGNKITPVGLATLKFSHIAIRIRECIY